MQLSPRLAGQAPESPVSPADATAGSGPDRNARGNAGSRPRHRSEKLWRPGSFWIHAALLAAVLLAVLAVMRPSSVAVPDEGLYMAQAETLTHGGWSATREAPDVDPDGEMSRLIPQVVLGEREVPYARHALYPALLSVAFAAGGYVGTLGLSLLGLWGAAVTSALIARRMDTRLAIPTLWLIGAGSPLVFYGYASAAHSLGATCAGLAFVGITRWLDDRHDRRWIGLIYALPALWALVLLRSEGTVYALSLVAAIGLLAIGQPDGEPQQRRPPLHRIQVNWSALVGATIIGASVIVTYLLDRHMDAVITRSSGLGPSPAALATRASADPIRGSWASLLRPSAGEWTAQTVWLLVAVASLAAASVVLRIGRAKSDTRSVDGRDRVDRSTSVAVALLMLSAGASVVMAGQQPELVTGLFAAFPLMVAGLVWMRRSDLLDPLVRRMVSVVLLTGAGLVATLYANGGAAEWGGRFFLVLIPLIAPLVVIGLHRVVGTVGAASGSRARAATVCMAVVAVMLSTTALRAQHELRTEAIDTVGGTLAYVTDVARSTAAASAELNGVPGPEDRNGATSRAGRPLVVFANLRASGRSRWFWPADDSVDVLTTYLLERADMALHGASGAGRERVIISTDATPEEFDEHTSEALGELGWYVLDRSSTPGGHANLYLVGPNAR